MPQMHEYVNLPKIVCVAIACLACQLPLSLHPRHRCSAEVVCLWRPTADFHIGAFAIASRPHIWDLPTPATLSTLFLYAPAGTTIEQLTDRVCT